MDQCEKNLDQCKKTRALGGWVDGWVGGWVEAKAGLRIAYSNQKQFKEVLFDSPTGERGEWK